MTDENPFAAPLGLDRLANATVPRAPRASAHDIADAIARLNRHLAEPGAADEDRRLAGGRLRPVTWICLALATACVVAGLVAMVVPIDDDALQSLRVMWLVIALIFAAIAAIPAVSLLLADLRCAPRRLATDPVVALRSWLSAMRIQRLGYILVACCPTARERDVVAPRLGDLPVSDGIYALSEPSQVRAWLGTFARAGDKMVRWFKIGQLRIASEDGDVARVQADLRFQAWPQWANIVSVVCFLLAPLLGFIVGGILFYSLRRRHVETIEKILIRGQDSLWYLYDGDLIDGAGAVDDQAA